MYYQVRGECGYLSGLLYSGNSDERSEYTLDKLKTEHKRLQRKVCSSYCRFFPLRGVMIIM